jgi:hypothetical protein
MYKLNLDPRLCELEEKINDPNYTISKKKGLLADDILPFVSNDKSWKEIAKDLNLSTTGLMHYIHKYKINKRQKLSGVNTVWISDEDFMKVYSLSKSMNQMGRELKTTGVRIKRIIKRLGLEIPKIPAIKGKEK